MSRFALLLIGSALMLFVAACDVDSDEDATDTETEDTTDVPADDETNGDQDEAVPEDEAAPEEDSTSDESTGDDAAATDSEDEDDTVASESEDENGESDDTNDTNEEMPVDEDGEVVDPEDIDPEDLQPQETPGMFFDLTVEEANEMTAFEVVEPAHVPEGLEFQTIIGMASMEDSIGAESGGTNGENGENGEDGEDGASEDEAVTITFAYQQPPEEEDQQPLPVEFMQSTEIDMSDGMGPDAESEEISVGDREVTRVNAAMQTGEEIIAYVWSEGDVHYSLAAMVGGDLTEDDLEEMIASVPAA